MIKARNIRQEGRYSLARPISAKYGNYGEN